MNQGISRALDSKVRCKFIIREAMVHARQTTDILHTETIQASQSRRDGETSPNAVFIGITHRNFETASCLRLPSESCRSFEVPLAFPLRRTDSTLRLVNRDTINSELVYLPTLKPMLMPFVNPPKGAI
jgi:hypothetical protein